MVYMEDVVHCRLYAKLEMELLTWNFTQHLQVMDLDRPEDGSTSSDACADGPGNGLCKILSQPTLNVTSLQTCPAATLVNYPKNCTTK